jgi:predicted Zn finger-like uncharacterized protein
MPLASDYHLDGKGGVVYIPKSTTKCVHCGNEYNIEEEKVGNYAKRFTCPQCGTTWETKKPKPKRAPRSEPTALPTSTGLDSNAARRALAAGESSGPGMVKE